MTKSMRVFFTAVVFALIGGIVFAYAPVIKPLPSIMIGDQEDWWGTIDTNLFRFSDAIDLDDYVTDQDTTISELVWSFWEAGAGNLLINGITELADPADAVDADSGAKDIRAVKATIDFWDQSNIPSGGTLGTYPDFDPDPGKFPDPSTLNEVVSFFVSDGLFVDSGDMVVEAVDNDFDMASAPAWRLLSQDDFQGTTGWAFTGPNANFPDAVYTGATSSYDGSRMGVATDDTTSRFGFWTAPSGVATESNKLYKLAWDISTNQTAANLVPTMRLRVNDGAFAYSTEMIVESAAAAPPYAPPSTGYKTYNQYVLPLTIGSSLVPSFDVYDFQTPGDTGAVYLEELRIYDIDTPAAGSSVSVPALSSWTATTSIPPYSSPSSGTTGGLQLSSGVSTTFVYGFWGSSTVTDMVADTLYRAVFSLSSSDSAPPNCFFRVQPLDFQVSYRLKLGPAVAPDSDGEDYIMFWEAHDFYTAAPGFVLVFELGDFESNLGGTATLTAVTVDSQPVIP